MCRVWLSGRYDALSQSAGYRDVCLLLVMVPEAWPEEKGEEGEQGVRARLRGDYVCELQLQWRPFYELKSGEGHRRYVEFRNGLAE